MSTIDERIKTSCGVCGCFWGEHPTDTICWRYRPKSSPPPDGTPGPAPANLPADAIRGLRSAVAALEAERDALREKMKHLSCADEI